MCKLYLLIDREQTSQDGDGVVVASYLILGMLACGELSYIQLYRTTLIFSDLRTQHTEMLVMFNDPENEPREIGKLSIILCDSYINI